MLRQRRLALSTIGWQVGAVFSNRFLGRKGHTCDLDGRLKSDFTTTPTIFYFFDKLIVVSKFLSSRGELFARSAFVINFVYLTAGVKLQFKISLARANKTSIFLCLYLQAYGVGVGYVLACSILANQRTKPKNCLRFLQHISYNKFTWK